MKGPRKLPLVLIVPIDPAEDHRSLGALIDELGRTRQAVAELEAREKALRSTILTRGVAEAEGDVYRLVIVSAVRWSLDAAKVRAELGDTRYDACCRQTATTSFRTSVRPEAAARLAMTQEAA